MKDIIYGMSLEIDGRFKDMDKDRKSKIIDEVKKNCMESLKNSGDIRNYDVSIVVMNVNARNGVGWITRKYDEIEENPWQGEFIESMFISKNSLDSYQSTIV